MADVRSLLRSEQASRRINHPLLTYTKSGLLNCTVCHLIIKSESLWEGHLRSANHRKNAQNAQNGQSGSALPEGPVSKKRKIDDENDEEGEDARKKNKSIQQLEAEAEASPTPAPVKQSTTAANTSPAEFSRPQRVEHEFRGKPSTATPPTLPTIDEDEWAAFEREVVPLTHEQPPPPRPPNAGPHAPDYSAATISAAPVSAADLASSSSAGPGQQSTTTDADRRPKKDIEAEDEKEEEANRLMEEFEVMEGLEERVKRLKERREALRVGTTAEKTGAGDPLPPPSKKGQDRVEDGDERPPPDPNKSGNEKMNDNDDDDDGSDEDLDDWGF